LNNWRVDLLSVPEPKRKEFSFEDFDQLSVDNDNDTDNKSTTVIKGRKRALQEAFRRSLTSINDYYCITGEEMAKSYKPFIPLLNERIHKRHGSTKILTNIEPEVIYAAQELSIAGAEIRHIDSSSLRRCVIYDDDAAYFSIIEPLITHEATESVNQTEGEDLWIASNETSVIFSAKKRFLSDWERALPLDKRIKYIEKGIEPITTRVIEKPEEILNQITKFNRSSGQIYACSTIEGLRLIRKNYPKFHIKILQKYKKGDHRGVKWITTINTKSDAEEVRFFLNQSFQIRHVKDTLFTNFAVSDKMLLSSIDRINPGDMVSSMLTSNDPLYLKHYKNIFEKIWLMGIDAQERIQDIMNGNNVNIQVIPDTTESLKLTSKLFSSIQRELLIILSSNNGLLRTESSGGFQTLNELASKGIDVRILTSMDYKNQDTFDRIQSSCSNIKFRRLDTQIQALNRINILDREKTIVWEIKDDTSLNFIDALGIAIFIESKSTAISYALIFDSLWNQTNLYEQLQMAYENLKLHEKMQKEFIDSVAHELRTPLTPIIGLTERVKDNLKDEEQVQLLDIVIENGKKLHALSENVLDVTRIEGNLVRLNKELFDVNQLIVEVVKNFESSIRKDKQVNFLYNNSKECYVYADKQRIAQVISNLLDNSIKFIFNKRGGLISITVEQKKEDGIDVIIVCIKDNGEGIHPEIFPRLFTKFATKSFYGTGLGLYICKNIIKMHSGRIWAQNNKDSNGASFLFSIPLNK
jgi:signal transduction histidine kinase